MTSSPITRRVLLVTDRRAQSATAPAAGLRRYRLARMHGGRRNAAAPTARKAV